MNCKKNVPASGVPAIPYMAAVKQFAKSKGLFFFTWADMKIAMRLYEDYARQKN